MIFMSNRSIANLFRLATAISGIVFLFVFFIAPTQSFQGWLSSKALVTGKYLDLAIFLAMVTVVICYMLHRIYLETKTKIEEVAPEHISHPAWFKYAQFFLSVAIFAQAVLQLDSSLTYDESNVGSYLASASLSEVIGVIHQGNYSLSSTQQALALLSSYFSMQAFGVSVIALRLPALMFGLLFLSLLYVLSRRYLPTFVALFCYLNLCANHTVVWYMHSSRGYISLMLFSLLPFVIVFGVSRGRFSSSKLIYLGVASYALCVFTCTHGALFNCLLLISVILWVYLNRTLLSARQLKFLRRAILVGFLFMPLILWMAFNEARFTAQAGFLGGGAHGRWVMIGTVLGTCRIWGDKLILLFVLSLIVLKVKWQKGLQRDFVFVFLIATVVFFAAVVSLIEASYLGARYFLAFLIPYLIWLSEGVLQVGSPRLRRGLTVVLFFILGVIPMASRPQCLVAEIGDQTYFSNFIERVKEITRESRGNCYSFSGDFIEIRWAKIHFQSEAKETCLSKYVLFFPSSIANERPFPDSLAILRDAGGRLLYRR